MKQNKKGKYFKYAIGEIILVVIGILIALQINNWNENRKLQQREVQILKEIKSDLYQTKKDIERAVTMHKEVLVTNKYVLDAIHLKIPYSDSIYGGFADASQEFEIVPKTSGFENLKTIGLNTISNDSLRIAISNIFQLRFTRLQNDMRSKGTEFNIQSMLFPHQDKYFEVDFSKARKIPRKYSDTLKMFSLKIRNYDDFLKDTELFKFLQLTTIIRSSIVEDEMEVVGEIDQVIESIDQELKRKN
ncbi:DUF6090 family protein [Lacinutrix iliipiscaria]|uniref:DUF6090 family protein n=1 Tax=Lacinutrix iliipiscaria TaxID=1230532 RepID=A0ABW5WLQ8_9FLAO